MLRVAAQTARRAVLRASHTRRAMSAAVTHTGQQWADSDPKNVRFDGKTKLVNAQFAKTLIKAVPVKKVDSRVVSCNGGGGALGHPKVYINLDQPGPQACGYCGLQFELDHHHH